MVTQVTKPLVANEEIRQAFISYGGNLLLGVLAGMLVAFVGQSSSATVGLVLALRSVGLLNLDGAIPLILGDNVGATMTALIASIGVGRWCQTRRGCASPV